jgi:DNA-binding beta-propeller fold protein YncE
MTAPRGLAADPSARLFVSDTIDNRVELFTPAGAPAGGFESAGGPRPAFKAPAGIAVDPRGSVYVADQGNERVVRLWGDGTFLSEVGGPAILGGAQLSGVSAVAAASATAQLYVADANHNRVLVYAADGSLLARWGAGGGNGQAGSAPGEFNHPSGLAVNPSGEVYVADEGNDRVAELAPDGSPRRQWGGRGSANGHFHAPDAVALDPAGDVFVLDSENNRVQEFDAAGRFLAKWGRRGTGLGELSQPRALTIDCAGNVYVADTNNNRVERFGAVAAAAPGCLLPGTWPPPLDVAPALRVRLLRRAGVLARRAVALTVSCPRGCSVRAAGSLRGHGVVVPLLSASRSLPAGPAGHLRLRVSARALRRLRQALGRRATLSASVRILATGPTGRHGAFVRRYVVGR